MGSHDRRRRSRSKDRKRRKEHRRRRHSTDSESSDEEYRRKRRASKLVRVDLDALSIVQACCSQEFLVDDNWLQAKKVEKHLKKHRLNGIEYDDEDNPFGDTKLSERFVWGKKIEKEIEGGADVREMAARAQEKRHKERLDEIDKVKRRREQREAERAAVMEELEFIQRERMKAEAVELEKKEEEFHLEQAKIRAKKRLAAGRPKAIDVITNNLFLLDGFDRTAQDPSVFIKGLSLFQLQELQKDIEEYRELDAVHEDHAAFWEALTKVVNHEVTEMVRQEEIDRAKIRGLPIPEKYEVREPGWHPSLDADVAEMLNGKSVSELVTLEKGILEQLESSDAVDPDYWSAVHSRLEIYKSRATLREFHADLLEKELDKLRRGLSVQEATVTAGERAAQARAEAERMQADYQSHIKKEEEEGEHTQDVGTNREINIAGHKAVVVKVEEDNPEEIALEEDEEDQPKENKLSVITSRIDEERLRDRGEPLAWKDIPQKEQDRLASLGESMSPEPLPKEYTVGQIVIPEEDDMKMIHLVRERLSLKRSKETADAARKQPVAFAGPSAADQIYHQLLQDHSTASVLMGSGNPVLSYITDPSPSQEADRELAQLRDIAARSMGHEEGDNAFAGEVNLESKVYWWHEKYKPRKPKYFNRVHLGFDWNKYNKAHYDSENPPPKVVQGYKFNIFYPDLIDPSKPPTYKLERDPESPDGSMCIIRFSGGPPYEDIAFRILNKDWATDPKRGFKCVFDRGILQLYFHFKKQFYRR